MSLTFSYLFNFSVPYKETPQCVAGVHFGAFRGHHNVSILLVVLCWPILVTFPLKDTANTIHVYKIQQGVCFVFLLLKMTLK